MPDWGFYKGYEYEYFQAQNLMMMMMMMRGGWDTLHQTLIYGQTEKNEYSSNKTKAALHEFGILNPKKAFSRRPV